MLLLDFVPVNVELTIYRPPGVLACVVANVTLPICPAWTPMASMDVHGLLGAGVIPSHVSPGSGVLGVKLDAGVGIEPTT